MKWCETFLAEATKEMQSHGLSVNHACLEGVPAREIIGFIAATPHLRHLICLLPIPDT